LNPAFAHFSFVSYLSAIVGRWHLTVVELVRLLLPIADPETSCVATATVTEPEILDVDQLLKPIPGESPAGDERAYAHGLRDQLIELRREEHPGDFDEDMRPAELKHSDWEGVLQTAGDALRNSTKDLRVACHLIEAATKLHGFAGLHQGLVLLRRLIDECWDRIYPSIDDGDLDARAAPLVNMLDDPQRGVCFPLTVQMIPLIGNDDARYGLLDWQRAKQSRDPQVEEQLARAVVETPISQLEAQVDAIHGCQQEVQQLLPVLDKKLGADSPALTNLRKAIANCDQLVREGFLQTAHPGASDQLAEAPSSDTTDAPKRAPGTSGTDQAILTRSEAYKQLKRAAETLEKLEPHSPIPYLVKRAVQLGRLPFPKLIERLIRDGNVLEELGREFGLAGAADDGSSGTE
jgi:type VI secretion system protein ImpA